MKKNDLLLVLAGISFAVLFYEQAPGINFAIFSLIYGTLNWFFNRKHLGKSWLLFMAIHLICALNIVFINSALAIIVWIFSLLLVNGKTLNTQNSILFTYFSSGVSFMTAILTIIKKVHKRNSIKEKNKWTYISVIIFSLIIVFLFFLLYRGANPLFSEFTNKIDLSWINIPFIICCIVGFYLIVSLTHPFRLDKIRNWDKQKLTDFSQQNQSKSNSFSLVNMTGLIIFSGLNIMLLLLNLLDIRQLFFIKKLPPNINLSDFVHASVWNTVFSILLAIILIVIIQHIELKSKWIKILVYTWIGQSLLMLFHTYIRNSWYIDAYQLTYLRIGVFVFLSLAVYGLISTAFCLYKERNYWFLLHLNMSGWFFTLFFMSFFSWDRIITNYNLSKQESNEIDLYYLNSLSENNLDLLLDFQQKHPKQFNRYQLEDLMNKKRRFNHQLEHSNWQSYSVAREKIYREINEGK